jgi:general secretion pathway protein I
MAEKQQGFSLIEVLAALGVFSIGAMGLIYLNTHISRSAQHIEARFLAQVIAENVMTDTMTGNEALVIGITTGSEAQRRQKLSWTRTIAPTERADLLLLEISVADPVTGQVLARLQALRREDRG